MCADRRVAIVVDSAASLPPDFVNVELPHVVPMQLTIDGQTYLDGVDISPRDFYKRLRSLKQTPTTSTPSPADYREAYEAASNTAASVLCITVARRFSGSFDAAKAAADALRDQGDDVEIDVMDSESAAGGEGLIVTEALRAARGGASLQDVRAAADRVVEKVSLLALLDTLYYAWKSGRVPGIAHLGTSMLRIKPVFQMDRGDINNLARPRTRRKAIDKLLGFARERVGEAPVHAAVMHGDAEDDAQQIRYELASTLDCRELYVSEFSPAMGAHTGPGLLGIAFWTED